MPSEPKRKIDDLLESYAKRRREQAGAPLEITPANRAILQGEVKRKFPAPSRSRSVMQLLSSLWPRLVLAGGVAALVAVAIFLPLMKSAKPQKRVAQVIQPTASPATATLAVTQERVAGRESLGIAEDQLSRDLPAGVAKSESKAKTDIGDRAKDYRTAELPLADRTIAANSAVVMRIVPPQMDLDSAAPRNAPTQSAKFRQNTATSNWFQSQAGQAPQVLANFSMERSGTSLRVIDEDGSVYQGQVTNAPAEKAALLGGGFGAPNAPAPSQNFQFQVSGTNNRLQQTVLFTGSLTEGTVMQASDGLQGDGRGGRANPMQTQSQTAGRSQIVGQVQIGTASTNTFPISAAQTQ